MKSSIRTVGRWYLDTPERALDQAYEAALMIKSIEDEHFNGKKIGAEPGQVSNNVLTYFEAELSKYLKIAKVRLSEFQAARSVVSLIEQSNPNRRPMISQPPEGGDYSAGAATQRYTPALRDRAVITLEKLKFIDSVLMRYAPEPVILDNSSVSLVTTKRSVPAARPPANDDTNDDTNGSSPPATSDNLREIETISDKTGLLPRSILGTINRLKRELDPKSEVEVVQNFRNSKAKTLIALRFICLLILIPLLVQQVTKNVVLSDRFLGAGITNHFAHENRAEVFLNAEMEEEALKELQNFEERLKFQNLVNEAFFEAPRFNNEEIEVQLKDHAKEVADRFLHRSADSIKNVISDFASLIAFALVIANSRREIEVLKSFIDEIVYGLSDSAKAFIIILFTDMFVGFHSPHGWEVLLEGVSQHLGLPADRSFIFLFIATFPVILDTIFKYWIFRYLNRISPSAVATYRNMNE